MKQAIRILASVVLLLSGCTETVTQDTPSRVLTMGDSLLAWNSLSRQSVSHVVEDLLGESVIDRSVRGAQMLYPLPLSGAAGFDIRQQYRVGDWDWIILNGGGNDLVMGCGCYQCEGQINRLISADGQQGEIPALIAKLRSRKTKVIYVGYLRSPGVGSLVEHCRDDGNELESRIKNLTSADEGVYFVSIVDLIEEGDRSYHSLDMIHPSAKASAAIGHRIFDIMTGQTGA